MFYAMLLQILIGELKNEEKFIINGGYYNENTNGCLVQNKSTELSRNFALKKLA